MSLHRKHEVGIKASDVMYATGDLSLSVPKYKIPREERSPRIAMPSFTRRTGSTATPGKTLRLSALPGTNPRSRR